METRDIKEYVNVLLMLCEKANDDEAKKMIADLKTEMRNKFTRKEILAEGIVL